MNTESTLWFGEIESCMTEDIIMNTFKELGINPKSIKMIKDKNSNLNKNFCFVNFENMNEANKALNQLNGKKFPKSNINFRLNWANQNSEGVINLYLGNLSPDVKDIDLYNLFKSKYPSVNHVSIISDKGVSRGYGFVYFLEQEDCDKCLKEMDGFIFHDNPISVKERKSKKEEKRGIDNNNKKKKINYQNNKFFINSFNINDSYLNLNKRMYNNRNNMDLTMNKFNTYCKIKNNNNINNSKIFKENKFNLKNKFSFYPRKKTEEDISQESTFSSQEKDQDLSSSNSISSIKKTRKFSDNIDLLESNDHINLNKKVQESIDKMFQHCINNQSNNKSKKNIYLYNLYNF